MLHWPHALVCVVCLLGCKAAGADGEALIESVGQGQVAFRRKEMVETALAHTGAVADFLHADIAVAAHVNQVAGAVDQALTCVGSGIHGNNIVDRSVKVKPLCSCMSGMH